MHHLLSSVILLLTCQLLAAGFQPAPAASMPGEGIPKDDSPPTQGEYARPPSARPSYGKHLANFTTEDFTGSHYCYNCHHLLTDAESNYVSIISHWRSTMMANAAKDPLWQAKVQSEVRRNPGLKKVIEQKCATCHMPMAWTQAKTLGKYGEAAVLEDGFLKKGNPLHEAAMDGISCTLCHQIQDKGLGTKETFSGKFKIDTSTEAPKRIIYGPYRDPIKKPMETSVGFTPEFGSQINHSVLCGSCHTLFTPYVDAAGNVAGEFPEQAIFLEWRHSSYNVPDDRRFDIGENTGQGKICQECHMPHTPPGKVIISKWAPPNAEPKDHFSQHFFVGGNVFMLDLLQNNVDALGLTTSSEQLEQTKQRTLDLLQNQSARLSLGDVRSDKNRLVAPVTVVSQAGHKFPSGFPSRRLWLHFIVKDSKGVSLFESGKALENGAIAGNDNDENPATFEPHHRVISDPGQVQIYETVMKDTDGKVTYTLLRASAYFKDNRLLPNGFVKETAAPEIAVFGDAVGDEDFQGGTDTVVYEVDTAGFQGPFSIQAELLYSPVSHAFLEDLRKDRDLELVGRFVDMADKSNRMPIQVATVSSEVR